MSDDQGYEDQTKPELQDELAQQDLPVSGTKDELVERLEEEGEDKGDDVAPPVVRQPNHEPDDDGYVGVDPEYRNGADHTKRPQSGSDDGSDEE